MMYKTSDGMTFSSYTTMCDHLVAVNHEPEVKEYYRKEKEKMLKRQRSIVSRLMLFKVGDAVLHNVDASVVKSQKAPLLLGQSAMERF